MSKRPPTIRVTPVPGSDEWRVKRDGAQRASSVQSTQRAADRRAHALAQRSGGAETIVHGVDGRIRSKDTVGRDDPLPPRDREH